jgi:hypothetical protein
MVYLYIPMYFYLYFFLHINIYIHIYINIYIHIYSYMYIYIYIYIYLYVYTYIHIYTYMYILIYKYIRMYIYTGLHASKTYSEGSFEKPVPDSEVRIAAAEHEAPLLFDLFLVLVCSHHNQKDAIASSNRINAMTELFDHNRKKGTVNTLQGLLDACYKTKRLPKHVKIALESVATPIGGGKESDTVESERTQSSSSSRETLH